MDFIPSRMEFTPLAQTAMAFVQLLDVSSAKELLLLPVYASALSASILLLHFVVALKFVNGLLVRVSIIKERRDTVPPPGIGKGVILLFRVARLLGCLGLLAISIFPLVQEHAGLDEGLRQVVLSVPYLYASILAAFSVSPKNTRHQLIRHANSVLFLAFCVYVHRDIFPLATFAGVPADQNEGQRMWAKIALLLLTAVVIPCFTPRQYIPVDPLNPQTALNPEQTASILSFAFYFFLDRIIFLAYRNSKLDEEELYPLCDTDTATHLKNRSFKYLDSFSGSKSRRHIFFGLMRVYHREFAILAGLLLVRTLAAMSGPFAMNRLLLYIETREENLVVRPWVWILVIFLGPLVGSLSFQWYIFINTRTLVRTESIITQLVFAHSLRIRVKAETTSTKEDSPAVDRPASTVPAGSDTDSTDQTATPENGESPAGSEAGSSTVQPSSASIKSTATKQTPKPKKQEVKEREGSLIGKINNMVTTDLGNITDSREFLQLFISIPLQLALGIWFIYTLLGWSVWIGVASIILLAPVPGYMAKVVQSVQKERLKRTDDRVQSVSEAVNVLRMVKLFGWEEKMKGRIADKRESELIWIRKRRIIDLASGLVKYTLIMRESLTASKVFSSMTVFDLIRECIAEVTWRLNTLMSGKVSIDRVNDFLKKTELLDAFTEKETPELFAPDPAAEQQIGFRNAAFAWSKESDWSLTRSQGQFLLKIEGELLFQLGRINLVVGPTGSGEMHWIPSSPDSWYNLPRVGGVAYAAQESWVLNETIRDNIVFHTPFDEERYKKVLYQCALEPDLNLFQAGDQTEVGEKGLTLSGGQKARLTLARAVYSNASILLLDDVLAALDVHTAQWIIVKCFGGDLIENRTVILVTHNVALARPIADFVVTFGSDGKVRSQGSVSELTKRGPLATQIRKDQQVLDKTQPEVDAVDPVAKPAADGKLIVAEEIQLGHVSASSVKMYLLAIGGNHPFFFYILFFAVLIGQQVLVVLRIWILGYWARQYDEKPADEVDVHVVAIVFTSTLGLTVAFTCMVLGTLRASKVIHTNLITSVLRAPLRWLDVTPTSRILARVTNDVRAVDDSLANQIWPLTAMVVSMAIKFITVIGYTPIFILPGLLVGILGAWFGQTYIAAQLPVKRWMSNTRAPVLAHFGAAITGLVSIRAYGAESKFGTESLKRIDRYTRAARNYYNLNRWVGIRVDLLGSLFAAALATYLVRIFNEFEVQGAPHLERIQGYINIEHEKPATEAGKPPAYWPASGDLRVEGLSASYSEDGPKVLHDISFHIKAGERIGIVGRTGSGKSSLTLSLLRCIPTEGSVRYDGLETSELNLDAVRSSITIIPQVPELLAGSLRANLDPFGQYDDAELNYALRAAGLFALQNEMYEGRITLDSAISIGGSNLSVGQRQVLALARAIVRKSKILILDEDYATDSIIQTSLRQELRGDVSLITVAHRLQTILDADKIMVLDAGRIVEFASPKELLKIKDGKLRALVDESGDRDALYAMAGAN
ncbi:P-loop containing nucleoside triphosphate hydrolase protein [Mycena galopus ATCC 62051]|nr:P-loop containing nucleoside triphosphate hydrolase protein [Mycena galopus ATCC 62051]